MALEFPNPLVPARRDATDPWICVVVDGHRCIVNLLTGQPIGWDSGFDPDRVKVEVPAAKYSGVFLRQGTTTKFGRKSKFVSFTGPKSKWLNSDPEDRSAPAV